MLFRVFQGQGKKASLAFNSEFHEQTGKEVYGWYLFHVRILYSTSGLRH